MSIEEKEINQNEEVKSSKSDKKSKKDKTSQELEKIKADYEALNDRYMRTLAEYDNFRKRTQKDIEQRVSYTKTDILSKILPVVDNFERAAFNAQSDFDGYKKGIEMTLTQLSDILKNLEVESFGEVGDEFDPNLHEAIFREEKEGFSENQITEVLQKGYAVGDKVIRHAMVKVSG